MELARNHNILLILASLLEKIENTIPRKEKRKQTLIGHLVGCKGVCVRAVT
jgi:hypothetical protein